MFALKVVGQYWGMTQFDVFEATFKAEKWNVKEDWEKRRRKKGM
jgi:hypothetical protein